MTASHVPVACGWQRRLDCRLPPLDPLFPSRISTATDTPGCRRAGPVPVARPNRQQTRHTGKGLVANGDCPFHWLPAPCRSPGPRFLFSRPTCSLSLRLSPVTRASPPTRTQAVTRRLSGGGPGCYSPPVWRKPGPHSGSLSSSSPIRVLPMLVSISAERAGIRRLRGPARQLGMPVHSLRLTCSPVGIIVTRPRQVRVRSSHWQLASYYY